MLPCTWRYNQVAGHLIDLDRRILTVNTNASITNKANTTLANLNSKRAYFNNYITKYVMCGYVPE